MTFVDYIIEQRSLDFLVTSLFDMRKCAFQGSIKEWFNSMYNDYKIFLEIETKTVDIVEIQKDLYKTKAMAKLLYYEPANGDLIYTVNALGKDWIFPIHTIQKITLKKRLLGDDIFVEVESSTIKLTDDLKGARFEPEIKGSSLIRWIKQAINNDEFH